MKRKLNKRALALIVCLAVTLSAAVGATLAYVFTHTNTLSNIFTTAQVSCAVVENGIEYTGETVTVSEKGTVAIKNTGNTDAYIRAAVVITWKNEAGGVYAQKPVKDTHYTVTMGDPKWVQYGDYYYYTTAVGAKESTGVLITEAKLKDGVTCFVGPDGTKYYFSIEIVASAIQASPADVVEDTWKVRISEGKVEAAPQNAN